MLLTARGRGFRTTSAVSITSNYRIVMSGMQFTLRGFNCGQYAGPSRIKSNLTIEQTNKLYVHTQSDHKHAIACKPFLSATQKRYQQWSFPGIVCISQAVQRLFLGVAERSTLCVLTDHQTCFVCSVDMQQQTNCIFAPRD